MKKLNLFTDEALKVMKLLLVKIIQTTLNNIGNLALVFNDIGEYEKQKSYIMMFFLHTKKL